MLSVTIILLSVVGLCQTVQATDMAYVTEGQAVKATKPAQKPVAKKTTKTTKTTAPKTTKNEETVSIFPTMAVEAPEYYAKLKNNTYKGFVVVDKETMRVIYYDRDGYQQKAYKMACARNYGAKHKSGDCRTPEGFFTISGIFNSTDWLYTNEKGVTSPTKGVYGPRFIRLKTPVTSSVGIHGTGSPGSLGKRVSHGCIRLANESVLDLVKYVEKGMPVIVVPGQKDIQVNKKEGRVVAHFSTTPKPQKVTEPTLEPVTEPTPAPAPTIEPAPAPEPAEPLVEPLRTDEPTPEVASPDFF